MQAKIGPGPLKHDLKLSVEPDRFGFYYGWAERNGERVRVDVLPEGRRIVIRKALRPFSLTTLNSVILWRINIRGSGECFAVCSGRLLRLCDQRRC
jgi:hypothetical protein